MDKRKIEQIAIDTYLDHSAKYSDLKDKWIARVNRYDNELRAGSITAETQSKARLGQAYSLVENFVSKIVANPPRFHYLPRETDDVDFVEQYEEFNEYQHEQARSKEAYERIAKWAGVCGLSGYKMGWKVEQILHSKSGKEIMGKVVTNPAVVYMMDRLKIGKSVKVDDNETISNWTIDAIAPYDLFWSVEAIEKDDCAVLGHVVHNKTYAQLKAEGYDLRRLTQRLRSDTNYWQDRLDRYKGIPSNRILDQELFDIGEAYVKAMNDQGVWEYWVVTIANLMDSQFASAPVSIRTERNQYDKQFCPIGIFRPVLGLGKFYGKGIIEPVEGVLDVEEDTLNMVIEAFWTDVARPMEYNPNNVIDEASLEYKPRTLVPVRRLGESIRVMETPSPNMGSASFILTYLERAKQNVSAITDYQTGANQLMKSQTATEVNTKTFLSEQRSNKILQRFETEVLEPSGKMALWLNQQYLADQKEVIYRVLGRKGRMMEKKMKFKVVEAIKDVSIVGGSTAYIERNQKRNEWLSLLQLANQESMLPNGVPINRQYIWERLVEDGYGVKDSENLIPSLKEQEEATVQMKLRNIEDAKQENLDPATARVLPNDIDAVHIALHKAALQAQGAPGPDGQIIPYTPEQMVLLTSHLNAHVAKMGGAMSPANMAMEQAVGQRINNQMNPQGNGTPATTTAGQPQLGV
jgi:hypothetical protein